MAKIRFGKYKGKEFDQIPASYLIWCYENEVQTWDTGLWDYLREHINILRKEFYKQKIDKKNEEF